MLLKAELLEQTRGKSEAIRVLEDETDKVSEAEQKANLLSKLGDLYRAEEKPLRAIVAYERALRLDPHRKHARFHAAYLCADIDGLKLIGLRQYRILREQDKTYSSSLNNLGVLYGELDLPISKVALWKAAAAINEDYGYGNLIIAFLEAGFFEEADKLVKAVPASLKSEERFVYAQSLVYQRQRGEQKKLESLVESAERIYQPLHEFDFELNGSGDLLGAWVDDANSEQLTFERSGEFIKIEQIGAVYRRWGIVKEIASLAIVSVQQESKDQTKRTTSTLAGLLMDGPRQAGHFIICRGNGRLRLLHVEGQKLVSRTDYSRKS